MVITSDERQKTALITGASSGIGYSIAKELASRGYRVYAAARRLEAMEPLKAFGITPVRLDVSQLDSVIELKELLGKELIDSKLDILYNNAGQSCTIPTTDVTDAQLEQAFQTNTIGAIRVTRELVKFVINAKGTILFTSSLVSIVPFPFSSIYCATKAALSQYSRVLHLELKGFGVRVINVVTGGVKTDGHDTRPIPQGSLFDFEEARTAFESRKYMSKNNEPMAPGVYAKQVVNDIESGKDLIDVYRGTWGFVLGHFAQLAPRWLIEWILVLKFKINPVYKKIRQRDEVNLHLD
ncbi:hypothetical protein WICMUC_001933 [Wickerhamomyces mucosus]|uniref:NADPH-dependent 1-acyldihydroxyacetone phosphate reductase n=1 Tax=Wickerhamomyces mucosus TaxID=1378264 RepID=A0A9P8PRK8_9ASCO|nr:hypothetical protein WICMUC_001933 [Wickerhamomyces mucosus]